MLGCCARLTSLAGTCCSLSAHLHVQSRSRLRGLTTNTCHVLVSGAPVTLPVKLLLNTPSLKTALIAWLLIRGDLS
jgi:hypothetical protein